MANVTLHKNTPIELYSATGIASGTPIIVYNDTASAVRLAASEAGLDNDCIHLLGYRTAINKDGDQEAWVISLFGGKVDVQEA